MAHINDGNSTFGAGKSGATSKAKFGPDSPAFWWGLGLVAALLSPLTLVTYVLAAVASQVRRVRSRRMLLVAAIATVVCLVCGLFGGGLLAPLWWHVDATSGWWIGLVPAEWLSKVGMSAPEQTPWTQRLLNTAPLAVPVGLWIGWFYTWWMEWRRAPMAKYEGKEYSMERPHGKLDDRRANKNRELIASGGAVSPHTNPAKQTVGAGVGRYGQLVDFPVSTTLRPMLVLGGPRQGKTNWTRSFLVQLVTLGSGVLIIDFKADEELPTFWAEVAHHQGREFRHFQLMSTAGDRYRRPHPNAPDEPAYYDPLVGGNATSKMSMLVGSVGREGDAAAYLRAQEEAVQVIYQVAHMTGYDKGRSGFQVLQDLLDMDQLKKVVEAHHTDGNDPVWNELSRRVTEIDESMRRDPVLAGACQDARRLLSSYQNSPAIRGRLRPGPEDQTVDMLKAVLEGHIVLFSLSVQEYASLSSNIGTLALLDLQNALSKLRVVLADYREERGDPDAPAPWPRFFVDVEEFGSAAPEAMLGVLNKAGDVNVSAILSTQSLQDIVAVDGSGTFARRVMDQVGNVIVFSVNDGQSAEMLSEMTPQVTKHYFRSNTEYSGGLMGVGLKAANKGSGQDNPQEVRQVNAGAFQGLPKFRFIWISKSEKPGHDENATLVAHTFKAGANAWWEVIDSVPVSPSIRSGQAAAIGADDLVKAKAEAAAEAFVEDESRRGIDLPASDQIAPLDGGPTLENPWGEPEPTPAPAPAQSPTKVSAPAVWDEEPPPEEDMLPPDEDMQQPAPAPAPRPAPKPRPDPANARPAPRPAAAPRPAPRMGQKPSGKPSKPSAPRERPAPARRQVQQGPVPGQTRMNPATQEEKVTRAPRNVTGDKTKDANGGEGHELI